MRDKVRDYNIAVDNYRNNNENVNNTNFRNPNARAGSGRLLTKKITLKNAPQYASFDETATGKSWRDANNNHEKQRLQFRRTSSTNCLQEISRNNVLGDLSREA